ncbi:MAG TPA: glucoamylase family protein, partial [Candidatus Kapabacteria bacterium]|nr:glucoamylase family protein [Candidatus Kapabacteria bacterium]
TFRQSATDGQPHSLWVDNIHFSSGAVTNVKAFPPIPSGLMARTGDRSVTLHWQALPETRIQYRIYRKNEGTDAYSEVPESPVRITSFADNRVKNGTSYQFVIRAENEAGLSPASHVVKVVPKPFTSDDDFLEYVQACAFDYFWFEANRTNGMVRDRSQPWSAASIAAIGFGLTAIGIGIDHQWITRSEGAERVLRTLETLGSAPQGPEESGTAGYKGWFYHFLDSGTATRYGTSELSSIDSALLFAGVLYAAEFFDNDSRNEQAIRSLAKKILNRVDWRWMLNNEDTLAMGWYPERGFTSARWTGYNEASILYLLGLGSEKPGGALNPEHWSAWTRTYSWNTSHGFTFIPFPPLFGHQYTACWVDFRDIADDFGRAKGITYFENSRRATLAQRAYCIENPGRFPGYGADVWGLTACDGPGSNQAHAYIARGAPPAENDDGTIAPTAAGGSLPFAPAECVRALRTMYDRYREQIWCGYGFRDAFNLQELWWGEDVIGIDQGPILIMAENLRTGRVWEIMQKSPVLERGLKRAGFRPIQGETPRPK